jgi:hypothetical protein
MSYIGNQITGFLGTGSLTVTTSTVAVEGNSLFSADGNVVIGDASGDTITINAATASIPNNLNIDSNTLFLNASNNRVGIGNASPATALDVTGTVTSDGLVISGGDQILLDTGDISTYGELEVAHLTNGAWIGVYDGSNSASNRLRFATSGSMRMVIDENGNVGIGAISPITISSAGPTLEVSGTAGGTLVLTDKDATSGQRSKYLLSQGGTLYIGDSADDGSSPSNNVVVDASGQVGIGTSSPSSKLHVNGTAKFDNYIHFGGTISTPATAAAIYRPADNTLAFSTANTEAFRVDSSQNLLVGTTTTNPQSSSSNSGVQIGDGFVFAGRTGEVAILNRQTSDGDIAVFRKDGSTVGSIGAGFGLLTIGKGTGNLLFEDALVAPAGSSSAGNSNGVVDLGSSGRRFKDLYLSSKAIINRDSDDDFIQLQRGGTTRARIGITSSDNLYIDATTNGGAGLQFWGAGGSDPYITPREEGSDNDNVTSLGRGVNRFKDLYLGGSVYLGGTGSANALDDYEKGSWTPTNSYVTYSSASGFYTKVGDIVILRFDITWPTTTDTNLANITGLPFNSPSYNGGFTHWTTLSAQASLHIAGTTMQVMNPSNPNSTFQNQNMSGKRIIGQAVITLTS